MGMFRTFWQEFIAAFRAERRGGEAAAESRGRMDELRQELKEEKQALKISKSMVMAKTSKEKEAVRKEVIEFVLAGPSDEASLPRSFETQKSVEEMRWSENPGAHEAHLIRRHNNPYFAKSRRIVSAKELEEAKARDDRDYAHCQQELMQIMNQFEAAIAVTQMVSVGEVHAFRERLDELIFLSLGVGGPATETAVRADRIREAVISTMRSGSSNDTQALKAIERADRYHKEHVRKHYIPVLAQMLRKDSPIPKDETISAVLSEDPKTISLIMECFAEDVQAQTRMAALQIIRQALDEGHIDSRLEAKIAALGS